MSGSEEFQKTFWMSIKGAEFTVLSGSTKDDLVNQLNALGQDMGFTGVSTGGSIGAGLSGSAAVTNGAIYVLNEEYGTTDTFDLTFVDGATGAQASLDRDCRSKHASIHLYAYWCCWRYPQPAATKSH